MDHDQHFKALVPAFFEEFMRLFFHKWTSPLNYSRVEWLQQEVYPNPPEGSRHVIDLVAKLSVDEPISQFHDEKAKEWMVLILIEIESSDSASTLRDKIPYYFFMLRKEHQLPVLPIALFLKVGMDGIGTDVYSESFADLEILRFNYLYVGLSALPALEYFKGESYLGVALSALMRIPEEEVIRLGAEALKKIQESPLSEHKKFLLSECVEAYLPLTKEQQVEFEALMQTERYRGVKAVNLTSYEKGIEKGVEKGIEKGRHETLLNHLNIFLESRFKAEGKSFFEQLPKNVDSSVLDALLQAAYTATDIANLRKYLP